MPQRAPLTLPSSQERVQLMKWYFENCRLSHILLVGLIVWAASACFLLQEVAPAIYVVLHAATTGVFFIAFLMVDRRSREAVPQKVAEPPAEENQKSAQSLSA